MNCVNHRDVPAVGQCPECGAGLCGTCYNYFTTHVCYECAAKAYAFDKRLMRKTMSAFVVGGIIGLIVGLIFGISMVQAGNGAGMAVFTSFWGILAGSSYGMALLANRGQRYPWYKYLGMLIFAIILAPIYFIIRLVGQVKLAKIVKEEKLAMEGYPRS